MKVQRFDEFVNEQYDIDYLSVLISKMKNEGKNPQFIRTYFNLLNIDLCKVDQALARCYYTEIFVQEAKDDDHAEDLEDIVKSVDQEVDAEASTSDDEDDDQTSGDDKTDKKVALRDALDDIDKMEKIKDILGESENTTDKFDNGKPKFKGSYDKDDNKTGIWIYYHDNGKISGKGPYKENLKHGTWEIFDKDGKLTKKVKYHEGKES